MVGVSEQARSKRLAYITLVGHPEAGEERFLLDPWRLIVATKSGQLIRAGQRKAFVSESAARARLRIGVRAGAVRKFCDE